MYMYYFLGYKLWSQEYNLRRLQDKADNTFLLALDGDVDFEPKAMLLLVDLLRKDEKVGAACGRIHPTGSGMLIRSVSMFKKPFIQERNNRVILNALGPMVWYQKFEYAMGHWMQKATEHVFGEWIEAWLVNLYDLMLNVGLSAIRWTLQYFSEYFRLCIMFSRMLFNV